MDERVLRKLVQQHFHKSGSARARSDPRALGCLSRACFAKSAPPAVAAVEPMDHLQSTGEQHETDHDHRPFRTPSGGESGRLFRGRDTGITLSRVSGHGASTSGSSSIAVRQSSWSSRESQNRNGVLPSPSSSRAWQAIISARARERWALEHLRAADRAVIRIRTAS